MEPSDAAHWPLVVGEWMSRWTTIEVDSQEGEKKMN